MDVVRKFSPVLDRRGLILGLGVIAAAGASRAQPPADAAQDQPPLPDGEIPPPAAPAAADPTPAPADIAGGEALSLAPPQAPRAARSAYLDGYRFGPGDQLKITVFGEPDLSGAYAVNAQGAISFPLIGDVAATSLTADELVALLMERLREGYLRQPRISLEVTNYRPFYILGEVSSPGTYPYVANLTVLNAVATAGGFTYRANRRKVFIRRADQEGESAIKLTSTTPVLPGDTIRIPERRF